MEASLKSGELNRNWLKQGIMIEYESSLIKKKKMRFFAFLSTTQILQ